MAAHRRPTPSYLEHKQSGRARAVWTDDTGTQHDRLLSGPYGSAESRKAYARLLLELEVSPQPAARPTRDRAGLGSRRFVAEAVFGLAAACAAANYWWATPRLRAAQAELAGRSGAFHAADRADPAVFRFTELHQLSTTLFLMALGAAFVGLVCLTRFRPHQPAASPARPESVAP